MGSQAFRTEKDSMGEVQVPVDALYSAQTQRAVDNFTISSDAMPWKFIAAVLLIKSAAAKANYELGLLEPEMGSMICSAVEKLLQEKPTHQFPVSIFQTGSGTSTNMNVNEVIVGLVRRKKPAISPNDHVNLGQSSNDVIPSALQLAAATAIESSLLPALKVLAQDIRIFGKNHKDVIKTARTHLMDALPIRLQEEFEAWAAQLDESVDRLNATLTRLRRLPLGGTAVGSGVNCHPDFPGRAIAHLNDFTGLIFSQADSLYKGLSSLDSVVELSGQLKTCAVVLSKIANDLRWMNSGPLTGLGEVQLPALQPGSSIMPAKVNPVIPEAVCMAAAQVIGNDTAVNLSGLGGSFQLNTMLPLAASNILQSIDLLAGSATALGEKAIKNMKINRQVFELALSKNPILCTSLTPLIGYLKAAEIGKIAREQDRTVFEVALEQTDIPQEELQRLLDPKNLADGGK